MAIFWAAPGGGGTGCVACCPLGGALLVVGTECDDEANRPFAVLIARERVGTLQHAQRGVVSARAGCIRATCQRLLAGDFGTTLCTGGRIAHVATDQTADSLEPIRAMRSKYRRARHALALVAGSWRACPHDC